MLNNMKRKLLETQHSKFEYNRFGFIEYVQNRESIILFQEHKNYSYLNHIIIFTKLFRNVTIDILKCIPVNLVIHPIWSNVNFVPVFMH